MSATPEILKPIENTNVPEVQEPVEVVTISQNQTQPVQNISQQSVQVSKPDDSFTPPVSSIPVIQVPSDTTSLTTLSKGSITNSLTWWGSFWLRMVKKAVHFGWKVVFQQKN